MINGGSFSHVKVTPRRTVHRVGAPVPVIVTVFTPKLSSVVRPIKSNDMFILMWKFCGQAMVTYLIDVNHISLGNVVGHYG